MIVNVLYTSLRKNIGFNSHFGIDHPLSTTKTPESVEYQVSGLEVNFLVHLQSFACKIFFPLAR